MHIHTNPAPTIEADAPREDRGFTLVEILIAIVLVGILSAVAVVGISNLTSKGATSACNASLDASKAASTVYFGTTGAYPTTFGQMTTAEALTLPTGTTVDSTGKIATNSNWVLTMTVSTTGGAPTFACS